jgi:C-terminal processing protease CtpA/Prc
MKVTTIEPGSPAAIAGLLVGDFIVEANGKKIEGAPARELAGQMREVKSGPAAQGQAWRIHLQKRGNRGRAVNTCWAVVGLQA